MKTLTLSVMALTFLVGGCGKLDPNSQPIYGKESGLPVNCRAYVQVAVDGYRNKTYSAEGTMAGLERNCGMYGAAWSER